MKKLIEPRTPTGLTQEALDEIAEANERMVAKNKQLAAMEELIEIKKNRSQQENALRPLFLNIGMAISILLAIIAINWKSYTTDELLDLGQVEADVSEVIEIPISKQPPPPPVKQQVFQIAEVKDTEIIEEIDINLDVEVTEEEALEEFEVVEPEIEEEVVEEIFVIVEEEPSPKGGIEAFYAYMAEELRYPPQAVRLDVTGSVYVQFVIEKDGSITGVEVVKGIGAGCDEEAMRVIQAAPPWNPGKQRGMPVRVKKIIPVKFILKSK